MSNAKHTPGPWIPNLDYAKNIRGIEAFHGPVTVNVVNWNGIARTASENGQANARLIAAAPELLDAAMAFERAYEACNTILAPMEREAFDMMRAAIAKATQP